MADVLPLIFAALAAVKGIDAYQDGGLVFGIWWVLAAAAGLFHRLGWGLLAVTAFTSFFVSDGFLSSNHTVLIGWVAAILVCTGDPDVRRFLVRVQASTVYFFATVHKLNADFLSGVSIARRAPDWLPLVPAASGAVALEAFLAWATWTRSRWAFPAAVLLHAGIIAMISSNLYQAVLLASFNGTMVLLVYWATRRHDRCREDA